MLYCKYYLNYLNVNINRFITSVGEESVDFSAIYNS